MEDRLMNGFQAVSASVEALKAEQLALVAAQRRVEQILSKIVAARDPGLSPLFDACGGELLREASDPPLYVDSTESEKVDTMVNLERQGSTVVDAMAMQPLSPSRRSIQWMDDGLSLQTCPSEDHREPLVVKLEIVSARGLRNMDWIGMPTPYCTCTIPGQPQATVVETPVVKHCSEPEWNHTCSLEGYTKGDSIAFTVKDKDRVHKDDLLGRTILPSESFHKHGFYGPLMLSNAGKGVVAYLTVKVLVVRASDVNKDLEMWSSLHVSSFREKASSRRSTDVSESSDHVMKARSVAKTRHTESIRRQNSSGATTSCDAFQRRLASLVHGKHFDHICAMLIIMSGLSVGAEVQYSAMKKTDALPETFKMGQICFCIAFSVELLMRMLADQLRFLTSDEKWWNVFDVIVVASAVGDLMLRELGISDSPFLLFTRVIRIVRIVRIIAVVPSLKELKQMIYAIFLTFTSLCYAMLLIFMIMYIFALLFTEAATQHVRALEQPLPTYAGLMHDEYGTVPQTLLTLFKSFTGGVTWGEPLSTLFHLSWIYPCLFLIFITFCVFAFLNIITGFFCNNALDMAVKDKQMAIQQQLRDKHKYLTAFQEVFTSLDSDGSGDLSISELEQHLDNPAIVAYFAHLNLEITSAWDIFNLLDDDESGSISVEEFVLGCLELRGDAKTFDVARLSQQLRVVRTDLLQCMRNDRADIDGMRRRIERWIKQEGLRMQSIDKSLRFVSAAVAHSGMHPTKLII